MDSKTEILRTILDTRDIIVSGVVNDLLAEGVHKEDIKRFQKTFTKTVYAQFDSLVTRVDKSME